MLAAAVARPAGLLLRRALGRGPAALMATAPGSPPAEAWTETERYLFDLNGYLVVPQVFSAAEVAVVNAAIDKREAQFKERTGALRLGGDAAEMRGDGVTGRDDLGGVLGWADAPPLRAALAHPRLAPYYTALCGVGYRLDHSPFVLRQRPGADGFVLHGGAVGEDGLHDHVLAYSALDGRPRCTLLAASVQLTDTAAGEGGFVVLPGSHKSALPVPPGLRAAPGSAAAQPALRAGDVLLFSEACAHGTRAWAGAAERRVVLYRFAPATCGYGRGYVRARGGPGGEALAWPEAWRAGLTPGQAAVLEPPYAARLDRPAPAGDGVAAAVPQPRAGFKKDFDASVFGETYF